MKRFELKEICHLITDGKHGDCRNQENSGYFFISAKDIRGWKINYEGARQISKEDFEETHKRTRFDVGDVMIVSTGANIGDIAVAKDDPRTKYTTFQKSVALLKPRMDIVNPYFLAYLLSNSRTLLHNISSGSAQKNLLLKDLRTLEVNLPPLELQTRIADILGAYDDLIENNVRRILLLEEAARVRYNLTVADATETQQLANFVELVKRGISPKYVEADGIMVINQKCVRGLSVDYSLTRLTDAAKKISAERVLRQYDTLVNSTGTGTLGRVSIHLHADFPSTVDSHVTIVRSKDDVPTLYVSMAVLNQQDVISMMGEGSTNQTELSAKRLSTELRIPVVSEEKMLAYHESVASQFALIWNLQKQNVLLRRARDILLPRLMSGEIETESFRVGKASEELEPV